MEKVLTNWEFGSERQWTSVTPAGLAPAAKTELPEVQEAVRIMQESKGVGIVELFGPKIWKRTMCGCSVQMWQQLVGGNGKHANDHLKYPRRHFADLDPSRSNDVLRCLW